MLVFPEAPGSVQFSLPSAAQGASSTWTSKDHMRIHPWRLSQLPFILCHSGRERRHPKSNTGACPMSGSILGQLYSDEQQPKDQDLGSRTPQGTED